MCSGITTKLEQKLVINEHTLEKDGWHVNVDAGFESAKTVHEIAGGLLNLVSVNHMLRPFDHSALALWRAFHHCRWMFNVCEDQSTQVEVCRSILQKFLNKNSAKAAENAPPLEYDDAINVIKQECQALGLQESLLSLGDCYSGQRKSTGSHIEKKLDRCLQMMDKGHDRRPQGSSNNNNNQRNTRQRNRGRNQGSNNNNRGQDSGKKTPRQLYEIKLKSICIPYNDGLCSSPCVDGKKHICTRITQADTYRMCWASHPSIEHTSTTSG